MTITPFALQDNFLHMLMKEVNYIPIATTLFSLYFFIIIFKHWYSKKSPHVMWWMLGVLCYGAGTVTESLNTLLGYNPINFRMWYILGALLGGAPLAQGTVYLLLKRQTANILTTLFVAVFLVSTVLVLLTPLHPERAIHNRLGVNIMDWQFILIFVVLLNTYALLFLVGGAAWSAYKYFNNKLYKNRFWGNVLIATGGLLPGIGGTYTRLGHVEVLYVTEFMGIILIYIGYRIIRNENRIKSFSHSE